MTPVPGAAPQKRQSPPPVRAPREHAKREEPRPGYTAVGRVVRPHGIRGELRATSFSPAAPNLQAGARIYLGGSDTPRQVVRARAIKGGWTLEIAGIGSTEAVQSLVGTLIEAADGDVQRDDADSYFVHELIGLKAVTDDGVELGQLTEVLQMGSADVYVINGALGEILIPAIADVVRQIDIAKQFMLITLLPGILDDSK